MIVGVTSGSGTGRSWREEEYIMFQIDHVCLSVENVEKSIAFYEALDFKTANSYKAPGGSLEIHTLKDKAGAILELFHYASHKPAPEHTRDHNTDLPVVGIKHFGLRVVSIEKALKALNEKGFASDVKISTGRLGRDYFFIADPSGILVEIIEEP